MERLSGFLFFLGFFPYAWAIFKGETVPSPVSWAIWASTDTLALVAMISKKKQTGQLIGAVAGAWIITALAVLYGSPTMGSVEWVSIIGASVGILLWQVTGDALFAIICSQAAVFVGAFPTFVNAYHNPGQEDPLSWSIWTASCVCQLLAIKEWSVANALQPLNFTVIEVTMVTLVIIRPLF